MLQSRAIPFPVKLLAFAAVCNLALLAGLGWYIGSSWRTIAALQAEEFNALDRMGAARQANRNRANAARMGVTAGNTHWRTRYAGHQSDWNSALADLRRLAPAEFRTEAGRRLAESAERMFRIEEQAFDLALQGKGGAAAALLLAGPYEREQRTHSLSEEQINRWLSDRLQLALNAQRRRGAIAAAAFALAFPILIGLWFFSGRIALRHVRHHLRAEERLWKSEIRLRTLFEGIEDVVLAHDLKGRILDCNEAASRRLGYTREEMLALHTSAIEAPEFAASFAERCARLMTSGAFTCESAQIAKDGRRIPVDLNTRVIDYLGSPAILATTRDITERKRAEVELGIVRELVEAASAAKSRFLGKMSHEIRTPMNGILGMTELALGTALSSEQREYLRMVKLSAHSLLTLMNGILDFSSIEAGKLELAPAPFGLRDGLAGMMKALAAGAREKGLRLDLRVAPDVPDRLFGDSERLKQVIVNLVGNSIKFTDTGEIRVEVEAASPEHGEAILHFKVTDTGIGIAQNDLRSIFEPFRQADGSPTRKYGGAGLGLAISTQLAGLMGGEIWAESEPGKGSAVHFTAKLGVLEPDCPGCDLEGIGVLVVDDDAASRRILQEMLSSWRMRPTGADGLESALAAFDRAALDRPYDLVILEANISGGRGLELAESICQRAGAAAPAIILLTSTAPSGAAAGTPAIRACLRKPVKSSELMDAITTIMASASLEQLAQGASLSPAEAGRGRHILAAEDNLVNQRLLLRMLEKQGHSVVMVSNGREAAEAEAREKFDLALFDIQMPEMSGLEATAAIRARERREQERHGVASHLPIVAITANAMRGDRERCLAAGMDGYIAKPLHQDELFKAVENLSIIKTPAPEITFDGALFDGDPEFLAEIVNLFLETYPQLLSAIEDAVSKRDAAGLCRAAHTMKGAVANFGAKAVVEQARALEMRGENGDLSGVEEEFRVLRALMEKFVPELRTALKRVTAQQVVQ